ncbi:type I glyceraldehyde-3-phosphate dehydrogenase [Halalkalicoccus jeotgali]|uniref:glyceraldehyde-3-phosphate dehydrogenase (NAD(P)(+)) (phosphorylating) n=1 Tax=Halalkalicoccus jeotgali (strain DSM 18796 / CECT 7217 / JCM 14584 / KCTC 4019 / B3) TaxID=795797 RepID=D8J922_HALJB|nr:type I glyceraldehyde-3-phosphate dehydrogenase [Halalkalicoccus jeotgali]ADJ16291.1 glyceraldehyde-3-phosphate dehydrogenase, type I [Halalkalicoccus jeotgali B3]ELY37025.1 glyceraldehyde-3-phosphate dehydrogenase, type I [Halalkalicoccus jeotgali B3]
MSNNFENEPVRVGLNGFGRIGRNVFRAAMTSSKVELVGINDIMDVEDMHYLAKYDTVQGRLDGLELEGDSLVYEGTEVPTFSEKDPTQLPWDELDVDVAFEATGIFRTREDAAQHLEAGAEKVIISAPPKGETPVKTIVYGVNHDEYDGDDVVSNASCTTNSVAPVAKVLDEEFGIESGLLTTVHAYTGTQNLVDGPSGKTRRGRAAAENIIPTSTGAAQSTTEVLPNLEGKLDGMAMRVPVPTGSITDLVVDLAADVGAEEVNEALREAADGDLAGVLGYTDDEIVSRDIVGLPFSSYVDLDSTIAVEGGQVKVLTWYDNEYGFANRMLDLAQYVVAQDEETPAEATA